MGITRFKDSIEKVSISYPLGIDEKYDELVSVAEDPKQCWYCGKEAQGTVKCLLTLSRIYGGFNKRKTVDRTSRFRIHICKDCLHNHERYEALESLYARLAMIPGLIVTVLFSIYGPFLIIGRILIGILLGIFASFLLSSLVSSIMKKRNKRRFFKNELRTLEEHPFIRAMQIYESGVQSKDEYKLMFYNYKGSDVEEDLYTFKEYSQKS